MTFEPTVDDPQPSELCSNLGDAVMRCALSWRAGDPDAVGQGDPLDDLGQLVVASQPARQGFAAVVTSLNTISRAVSCDRAT